VKVTIEVKPEVKAAIDALNKAAEVVGVAFVQR
jgi:hypothetical protein